MSQFCISCGTENQDEAKFCKDCGKKLNREEYKSFDNKVKTSNVEKSYNDSSNSTNYGSKALKVVFAVIVAFFILSISAGIFQFLKIGTADLGQSLYENYGKGGVFFYSILQLLPLLIGVWLVKISWKKITN